MKVIGINGSARKDGNTAILINSVFSALNKVCIETELMQLTGQIIEPCKACWDHLFIQRMYPQICRRFWSGRQ